MSVSQKPSGPLPSLSDRQLLLLLALITILIHHVWFLNTSPLTRGDWFFDWSEKGVTLDMVSAWAFFGLGQPFLGTAYAPVFLLSLPVELLSGAAGFERVMYMWPIALGSILFPFLLVRHLTGSQTGAFFASLFFSLNTYFLSMQGVGLLLMLCYTLAPLSLYLFIRGLNERKWVWILANVVVVSYISFVDFRGAFLLLLALAFVALLHVLARRQWRWPLFILLVSGVFYLFINFFWLLNLMTNHGLDDFGTAALGLTPVGEAYQGIQYSLNVASPFWTGAVSPSAALPQPIAFWNWLIPIFLLLAFWFSREEKDEYLRWAVPGLALLGLFAIFMGKVTRPPFPDVFLFFFAHVPGFAAFRETGKFYILAAVALLIPLGYAAARLFGGPWMSRHGRMRIFLLAALTLILLYNSRPLVTGEMDTLFVPRQIIPSFIPFKDMVSNDAMFYRTLWIPAVNRYAFRSATHPAIHFFTFSDMLAPALAADSTGRELRGPQAEAYLLEQNYAHFLSEAQGVRYVVLTDDDPHAQELISPATREIYARLLSNVSYLKLAYQQGGLYVYETPRHNDHLYVARNAIFAPLVQWGNVSADSARDVLVEDAQNASKLGGLLSRSTSDALLDWKMVNPSQYEINANGSGPFLLVFSEQYNSQWGAYINQGANGAPMPWWTPLLQPPDATPYKVNGFANAFFIEPCPGACHVTLFYKPEAIFIVGALVSIPAFISLILLVYLAWRKDWAFENDLEKISESHPHAKIRPPSGGGAHP